MTGISSDNAHKNPGVKRTVQLILDLDATNQETFKRQVKALMNDTEGISLISKETLVKAKTAITSLKKGLKFDTSSMDYTQKDYVNRLKEGSKRDDKIAKEGISILKKTFGIIENVYQKIQNASPLLTSINSLFNLAVQLFFMPLGNRLAEEMLPAVLKMVDDVMAMWDAFEGKSLNEIISLAIEYGVKIFGNYFVNLGDLLKNTSNPLLSAIGNALETLGNFIKSDLQGALTLGINILRLIITHFKEIVATIVAFKVASLAQQASIMVLITASTASILMEIASAANAINLVTGGGEATVSATAGVLSLSALTAALKIASTGSGVVAGIGTELYLDSKSAASGAYVPATDGGQLYRVAEGGEGEYIVPESQYNKGGNTYYITVNGYTDTDLSMKIREVVNEMNTQNRLRSGF